MKTKKNSDKNTAVKFISNNKFSFRSIIEMREFVLFLIIIATCIGLSIASPYFLTYNNIVAVVFSFSLDVIIAVGMTYVIVSGNFDLSVGSTLALTGIVVGKLLLAGFSPFVAILIGGVFVGGIIGLINGVLVTKVGINSFITTLAMMGIIRGVAFVATQGYPIARLPKSFVFIGQERLLGIPYTFYVMFLILIIGEFLLRKTRFFRQTYYVGGNITAAKYSAINTDLVIIVMFIVTGILSGVAGVFQTARLGSAMCTSGEGAELRIISGVIIGGASLSGGKGTVLGSCLGVILLALVVNGLVLLNVSVYWQSIVSGLVLLSAVAIDVITENKRNV